MYNYCFLNLAWLMTCLFNDMNDQLQTAPSPAVCRYQRRDRQLDELCQSHRSIYFLSCFHFTSQLLQLSTISGLEEKKKPA